MANFLNYSTKFAISKNSFHNSGYTFLRHFILVTVQLIRSLNLGDNVQDLRLSGPLNNTKIRYSLGKVYDCLQITFAYNVYISALQY